MEIKVSKNLRLRTRNPEDVEDYLALLDKNSEFLKKGFGWLDANTTEEECLKYIESRTRRFEEWGAPDFGVHFKNKEIGSIGLHRVNLENKTADLVFWFDEDHLSDDIMIPSTKAVIRFAFEKLKFNEVTIHCAASNRACNFLSKKLHFVF